MRVPVWPYALSMRRKTGLADKISRSFLKIKELISFQQFMGMDDPFSDGEAERISDPYRSHSLVNIAVSTLMRNIGRASFRITRDGEFVTSGPVFELFRDVNPVMNRFDLWKVTSAWWFHVLILGKRRSGSLLTHIKPGFLRKYLFLIPRQKSTDACLG